MSRNALFVLEAVFVFSKKALSLRKKSCKKISNRAIPGIFNAKDVNLDIAARVETSDR